MHAADTIQPMPVSRRLIHTRKTTFNGYLRDDGLWDIEAQLVDTKSYTAHMNERNLVPAGEPVHDMALRLTLDDNMKVLDIATGMHYVPFGQCRDVLDPMRGLIGLQIGPGWRMAVGRVIGGELGCTHLRELLFGAATAAYQTIGSYRHHEREVRGEPQTRDLDRPPHYIGQCMSWGRSSPVVARYEPMFFRPTKTSDAE